MTDDYRVITYTEYTTETDLIIAKVEATGISEATLIRAASAILTIIVKECGIEGRSKVLELLMSNNTGNVPERN